MRFCQGFFVPRKKIGYFPRENLFQMNHSWMRVRIARIFIGYIRNWAWKIEPKFKTNKRVTISCWMHSSGNSTTTNWFGIFRFKFVCVIFSRKIENGHRCCHRCRCRCRRCCCYRTLTQLCRQQMSSSHSFIRSVLSYSFYKIDRRSRVIRKCYHIPK